MRRSKHSPTPSPPGSADRPKRGRPRADQVWRVEERILTTASALFFEQGFGRTTLDQIADVAHTSKSTLYGRYPSKDVLFAAIIHRYSAVLHDGMAAVRPSGPLRVRLKRTGIELANLTLTPDSIALMRFTLAEAPAFPDLAQEGFRIGFDGCVRCFAECIAGSDEESAVAAATPAAQRFHEMALHPLYFHAFFGADLIGLRERAARNMSQVIDGLCAVGLLNEVDS